MESIQVLEPSRAVPRTYISRKLDGGGVAGTQADTQLWDAGISLYSLPAVSNTHSGYIFQWEKLLNIKNQFFTVEKKNNEQILAVKVRDPQAMRQDEVMGKQS